jgi:corrinoid protein of di/trimethylamine methyltransferase
MTDENAKDVMQNAVIEGDGVKLAELVQKGLDSGTVPLSIINDILNPAIAIVGDRFDQGSMFLPELILSAEAMNAAMEVLIPAIKERGETSTSPGKIVLATVKGDVHDIGKNIVGALLNANGFEVIDMGRDVPALSIVEKAEEVKADIIGLSALLSTTLPYCRDTAKLLEDNGIRDKYHVFIGGGAATPKFAESIRCEYGGEHASAAVEKIKKIMGSV